MKQIDRIIRESIKKILQEGEIQLKQNGMQRQMVDEIPVFYRNNYIPENESATKHDKAIRDIIWVFKDDNNDYPERLYHTVRDAVTDYFSIGIGKTFGENAKQLTLVAVPASSQNKNAKRWKEFTQSLCRRLGMVNGYEHITYKEDALAPKHYGGGHPSLKYDRDFFKDRNVIIIDDIITSGYTLSLLKQELEKCGANVLCAFVIAKTRH